MSSTEDNEQPHHREDDLQDALPGEHEAESNQPDSGYHKEDPDLPVEHTRNEGNAEIIDHGEKEPQAAAQEGNGKQPTEQKSQASSNHNIGVIYNSHGSIHTDNMQQIDNIDPAQASYGEDAETYHSATEEPYEGTSPNTDEIQNLEQGQADVEQTDHISQVEQVHGEVGKEEATYETPDQEPQESSNYNAEEIHSSYVNSEAEVEQVGNFDNSLEEHEEVAQENTDETGVQSTQEPSDINTEENVQYENVEQTEEIDKIEQDQIEYSQEVTDEQAGEEPQQMSSSNAAESQGFVANEQQVDPIELGDLEENTHEPERQEYQALNNNDESHRQDTEAENQVEVSDTVEEVHEGAAQEEDPHEQTSDGQHDVTGHSPDESQNNHEGNSLQTENVQQGDSIAKQEEAQEAGDQADINHDPGRQEALELNNQNSEESHNPNEILDTETEQHLEIADKLADSEETGSQYYSSHEVHEETQELSHTTTNLVENPSTEGVHTEENMAAVENEDTKDESIDQNDQTGEPEVDTTNVDYMHDNTDPPVSGDINERSALPERFEGEGAQEESLSNSDTNIDSEGSESTLNNEPSENSANIGSEFEQAETSPIQESNENNAYEESAQDPDITNNVNSEILESNQNVETPVGVEATNSQLEELDATSYSKDQGSHQIISHEPINDDLPPQTTEREEESLETSDDMSPVVKDVLADVHSEDAVDVANAEQPTEGADQQDQDQQKEGKLEVLTNVTNEALEKSEQTLSEANDAKEATIEHDQVEREVSRHDIPQDFINDPLPQTPDDLETSQDNGDSQTSQVVDYVYEQEKHVSTENGNEEEAVLEQPIEVTEQEYTSPEITEGLEHIEQVADESLDIKENEEESMPQESEDVHQELELSSPQAIEQEGREEDTLKHESENAQPGESTGIEEPSDATSTEPESRKLHPSMTETQQTVSDHGMYKVQR
jgi:hypothetical protein